MRWWLTVIFLIALEFSALYMPAPAHVDIAGEKIGLNEPNWRAILMNAWGDYAEYPRCPISGVSLYWTTGTSLAIEGGGWFYISGYGEEALRRLIQKGESDLAWSLAEEAYGKRWREGGRDTNPKLAYPLKFFESP